MQWPPCFLRIGCVTLATVYLSDQSAQCNDSRTYQTYLIFNVFPHFQFSLYYVPFQTLPTGDWYWSSLAMRAWYWPAVWWIWNFSVFLYLHFRIFIDLWFVFPWCGLFEFFQLVQCVHNVGRCLTGLGFSLFQISRLPPPWQTILPLPSLFPLNIFSSFLFSSSSTSSF